MGKSASEEMTVGCVPGASACTFGQQTEMNHPTRPHGMGLQTGVGIDVIYKTTQHVHVSHLCCFANQGFRAIERQAISS